MLVLAEAGRRCRLQLDTIWKHHSECISGSCTRPATELQRGTRHHLYVNRQGCGCARWKLALV
jgi:hypothetical protein